MNKIILKIMLLLSLFVFILSLALFAQPSEKSLIETWETIQKNDPKTVVFQKKEENHYRFETEIFPFDGELRVLNISIDDRMRDFKYGYITGVIELELVNLPESFWKKHSFSYSSWSQNNVLYYDQKTGKWLSSREYYAKSRKDMTGNPLVRFRNIFTNLPIIILIFFIVFLIIISVKIQNKNKKYIDFAHDSTKKSLELSQKHLILDEETNKILKEILEVLKNKSG